MNNLPIIKPIREPWALPRCSATRRTKYYNDAAEQEYFCSFNGAYMVGDKALCKKHAADYALGVLLERGA